MRKGSVVVHYGKCFCGVVALEVSGTPEAMGYCHCNSCRSWSGGPVNAFSLWKPEAVRITSGAEFIATFQKTPLSQRKFCTKCGGHLMTKHPPLGLIDVFTATLPTLTFTPDVHVNYAETVLPMRDGLPKLRDFPAAFGGSGEVIAG
ncbi:MAG TPA: GFA family protein [Acetobacteraceae bacterium]|nr:GFA family protein [Acetobacteraceae bacterium]